MKNNTGKIERILFVEDDAEDVELTLASLAEDGLVKNITVANDGEEALDYLYCRGKFTMRGGGNPDLVLLDNKMPKVSGLEVLKIMKADEKLKKIPVVALTSSCETRDLIEFYKCGVNAYVVKPMDFSHFRDTVKQLAAFWMSINEPPPQLWSGPQAQDDEMFTSLQLVGK